jgi:hypothetical protein
MWRTTREDGRNHCQAAESEEKKKKAEADEAKKRVGRLS